MTWSPARDGALELGKAELLAEHLEEMEVRTLQAAQVVGTE
jgi:hypothetical protein